MTRLSVIIEVTQPCAYAVCTGKQHLILRSGATLIQQLLLNVVLLERAIVVSKGSSSCRGHPRLDQYYQRYCGQFEGGGMGLHLLALSAVSRNIPSQRTNQPKLTFVQLWFHSTSSLLIVQD